MAGSPRRRNSFASYGAAHFKAAHADDRACESNPPVLIPGAEGAARHRGCSSCWRPLPPSFGVHYRLHGDPPVVRALRLSSSIWMPSSRRAAGPQLLALVRRNRSSPVRARRHRTRCFVFEQRLRRGHVGDPTDNDGTGAPMPDYDLVFGRVRGRSGRPGWRTYLGRGDELRESPPFPLTPAGTARNDRSIGRKLPPWPQIVIAMTVAIRTGRHYEALQTGRRRGRGWSRVPCRSRSPIPAGAPIEVLRDGRTNERLCAARAHLHLDEE